MKSQKLKTIFLIILTFFILGSNAQDFEFFNPKINDVVEPYANSYLFSGTVLVARNGTVIFKKAYGNANVQQNEKNLVNTPFLVGSITKPIIAALVLKLAEEGKLKLDETIGTYLTELPADKASKITVHHLLGHRSGLQNYFQIEGWTSGGFNKNMSDDEFFGVIANMQLLFEPGSRYFYSNAGYYLLGEIIEKVTGKSYKEAIREYFLQPLEMTNTGIAGDLNDGIAIARDYVLEPGGYKDQEDLNMNLFKAAGDIYSTVDDIFKWEQALYSNELLSDESKSKLFNPENQYSWDFESVKFAGLDSALNTVSSNGQIEGYSSMITRFVDDRSTVIILSNSGMGFLLKKKMADEIARVAFDLPQLSSKKGVLTLLAKALYNNELDRIIKRALSLQHLFEANEELINEFGEQISWSGNKADAIKIFELNAKLFPDSPSAAFQLAEAYKDADNMTLAIEYYQKVLKHHPNNSYIKRIIEEAEQ